MNNLKVLLLSLALVGVFSFTPVVAQTSPPVQAPAKPTIVPFELNNRHMILKIRVNNSSPLSFILDTGDQYAVIDLERARELKLSLQGEVMVGGAGASTQKGAFVRDASFAIEGFPGFSQPVTLALPIRSLATRLGRDLDGIIGSEFIKEFVVEVDYQERVLRLHDKSSFSYTGIGESIPIELVHGHPIMDAVVTPAGGSPLKGRFVLDLGAGLALALYSPFVAEHQLLAGDLKTINAIGGAGAGGETTGRIGRVSELKIGSYQVKAPVTLFSQDKAGAFASSALAGNIGARVANKFKVFLDYGRKRIIFEPNSNFEKPFDHSQTGLVLMAEGSDYRTFRIHNLLENSPATEAGLQKDDVILSVNDEDAKNLTLSRLNELFEKPVTYKLTVRRGEQTLKINLTPRPLI